MFTRALIPLCGRLTQSSREKSEIAVKNMLTPCLIPLRATQNAYCIPASDRSRKSDVEMAVKPLLSPWKQRSETATMPWYPSGTGTGFVKRSARPSFRKSWIRFGSSLRQIVVRHLTSQTGRCGIATYKPAWYRERSVSTRRDMVIICSEFHIAQAIAQCFSLKILTITWKQINLLSFRTWIVLKKQFSHYNICFGRNIQKPSWPPTHGEMELQKHSSYNWIGITWYRGKLNKC